MFDPHRVLSRNRYKANSGRVLHAKATKDRSVVVNRADFPRYIEILKANGLYPVDPPVPPQPYVPSVTPVDVNIPSVAVNNIASFPFPTTLKPSLDQALASMSSDYNYLVTIECTFQYSDEVMFRLDNSQDTEQETYIANLPFLSITATSSNPRIVQLPFLVFATNNGSQWLYNWNLNPRYMFTFQNQNISGQSPPTEQDITDPGVYPYINVVGALTPPAGNLPFISKFIFTPFIKD